MAGIIHLQGEVRVQPGSDLRIDEGTHIVAHPGAKLTFGGAMLSAIGSSREPIVFCGLNPEPGSWQGIEIAGTADKITLYKVSIQDAQTGVKSETELDLDKVEVQNAGTAGFDLRTSTRQIARIHVARSNTAVIARSPEFFLDPHRNFSIEAHDNTLNGIELGFTTWNQSFSLWNIGLPYFVRSDVQIVGRLEIRIGQGTKVLFDPGVSLTIGDDNTRNSTLNVLGSFLFPVELKPRLGNLAGWGGIKSLASEFANLRLENTIIEGVRENFAIEALSPSFSAQDLTIVDSPKGIYLETYYHPELRRVSFKGQSEVGLSVSTHDLMEISDLDFSEAKNSSIVLREGYLFKGANLVNYGVPYILDHGLLIDNDETLTIDPGTQFLVRCGDTPITAKQGGNLIAVGKMGQEIVFSGTEKRPGCWPGITLDNEDSNSTNLQHLIVEYAGQRDQAMLRAWTPSIVTQCTFRHTEGPAIEKKETDTTDYQSGNQFVDIGQEPVRTLAQEFRALGR